MCLLIRQIPADFSHNDLTDLVTNNVEQTVTSEACEEKKKKKTGYQYSCGFNFVSHTDALNAFEEHCNSC